MCEIKSKKELYTENIIGVKVKKIKNIRKTPIFKNKDVPKFINQTMYLKKCWHCGRTYESKKINTITCSPRCFQHINRLNKKGLNPITNMKELTKPKNIEYDKKYYSYY